MLTPEQHEARNKGIGGSDAAVALGLSQFKTRHELWLEKTGRAVDTFEGNEYTEWGHRLEDVIAQKYMDDTGEKVQRRNKPIVDKQFPYMVANIDRHVVGKKKVLEIKTAGLRDDEWGEDGSDYVPMPYLVQCNHYMRVTGAKSADLAVLFMLRRDYGVFNIPRDENVIEMLIDAEGKFWEYVKNDEPPPPMNAGDVSLRWPSDNGSIIETDQTVAEAVAQHVALKAEIKALEKQKSAIEDTIKVGIGENAGLTYDGRPIATFKHQEQNRIDSTRLRDELPKIAADYSKKIEFRRLLTK